MNLTVLLLQQHREDIGVALITALIIIYLLDRWLDAFDRWLNGR